MKTLKAHGHTSEEAEDGLVAFGMVKEKGLTVYDAILMDFVMVNVRNFVFYFISIFFLYLFVSFSCLFLSHLFLLFYFSR